MSAENSSITKGEKPIIYKSMERPGRLKSEVKTAKAKMKSNNATGPNLTIRQMMAGLDEFGIKVIDKWNIQ